MASSRPLNPRIVVGPPDAPSGPWRTLLRWLSLLALVAAVALVVRIATQVEQEDARAEVARLSSELLEARQQIETLEQQLAVSERSAQITNTANGELRVEIVSLQEDIAGLRADVEFYQRLLGSGGSSNGLAVHALQLDSTQSSQVFRFVLTLSQNLKKARIVEGQVRLSIEGVRDDRPERLHESALSLQIEGDQLDYEFKYFQQLAGSFALPSGFQPERVSIRLEPARPRGAEAVSRDFAWTELTES